jgi:hypothetical protein
MCALGSPGERRSLVSLEAVQTDRRRRTDGQTDRQTDRQTVNQFSAGP